jgi:hypothetical protein
MSGYWLGTPSDAMQRHIGVLYRGGALACIKLAPDVLYVDERAWPTPGDATQLAGADLKITVGSQQSELTRT